MPQRQTKAFILFGKFCGRHKSQSTRPDRVYRNWDGKSFPRTVLKENVMGPKPERGWWLSTIYEEDHSVSMISLISRITQFTHTRSTEFIRWGKMPMGSNERTLHCNGFCPRSRTWLIVNFIYVWGYIFLTYRPIMMFGKQLLLSLEDLCWVLNLEDICRGVEGPPPLIGLRSISYFTLACHSVAKLWKSMQPDIISVRYIGISYYVTCRLPLKRFVARMYSILENYIKFINPN